MKRFYVTTPIYYINDVPSVGHSYTTIAADVLARWHRLQEDDVFFLTGLDENSQKTVEAAEAQKVKDIQKYANMMAEKWKKVWKILNISYDGFIRTTEKRHRNLVKDFFMKVYKKGDIYKGNYKGLYCGECEAYLKENELVNGLCPYHKKKPKHIDEENYFFKLSKYQKKLLNYIEKNPNFIQPTSRRNEAIGFIKKGLQDISISRQAFGWGIPLPINNKHRFWCWFDALLNYISGASKKYWPATIHLIGKDILRFHAVIWPAMLLSTGYKLPETIFAHGFFTVGGEKMSKSLGNVIDPVYLVDKYGLDPLRYFILREVPFGSDGDFSSQRFEERYNADLANGLGNLVARVLTLATKSKVKSPKSKVSDEVFRKKITEIQKNYQKAMEELKLHEALGEIWKLISFCDEYIQENKPWKLIKTDEKKAKEVLSNLLYCISEIANLIEPFLPETSEEIKKQLKSGKPEILFPRL